MDSAAQPVDTGLTPLTRASVTRDVTARLLDYLTSGQLTPGSRLPSERQLAEALQVGRSVIRETLAAFEVLGLVDSRPGSGTYLRQQSTDLLPTVINWGLTLRQPRTLDLVEARAELELITARMAAERATDEDIERLRGHLHSMASSSETVKNFIDADVSFHLEIADIARNTVLDDILHSVRSLLQIWVERAIRADGGTEPTLAEHRQVFEAIERRDPEAATTAMRSHMKSASARLKRSLENHSDNG